MMEQKISVDTHYTRSIHLEKDARSLLISYIPTSRALQTLEKIAATFNEFDMPRAWSLIGPYGSGKSAFALFLAQLLNEKNQAVTVLAKTDQPLAAKFEHSKLGYCTVLLSGNPESLSKRLVAALYLATETYFNKSSPIVNQFKLATEKNLTVSELIELVTKLQNAVATKSGAGILIIIDELGKFLEYDARQSNSDDIFLLQALAELARKGHKANLLLVVLMHQPIEQYAKNLGETAKNEWLKISGRFESVPFLESTEQTMRVIAAAFKNELTDEEKSVVKTHTDLVSKVLVEQSAVPNHLNVQTASELFSQCYPLHPLSLLILPVLCQKVAQNERTLFSYLGSQEIHGFKDSLSRLKSVNEWILPWEIFDYFIQNQPTATTDHLTHRRWAEVVTALERLGYDAPKIEIELLKTIGLLNIIGHHNGLKASCNLLDLTNADKTSALDSLSKKSIINFQRFSGEYRVWEGSDFDLDAAILEAIQHEGHFNLAEKLNQRKTQLPIVARKYSIRNGTLRYFQPLYIDKNSKIDTVVAPQIHFFLSENADDNAAFFKLIQNENNKLVIYVLCENAANYRAVLEEVCALERIQNENPLLKTDRVAQYEWRDTYAAAKYQEEKVLNEFLTKPELHQWFWCGEKLELPNKRALQNHLSNVLEKIYHAAPIIKNELINRHKPSSQGNSARNKLIAAMLLQNHQEDLGFEKDKFPPEKSIYRSLLKETGVHVEQNGTWRLVVPSENSYRLAQVWQGIDDFIAENNLSGQLVELYKYLNAPPFGIQHGVLPLLFAAYYLTNQRNCALYEDGIFCPQVTQENFEVLLKRPELFSFEKVEMHGIQGELFNQYLEKLVGKISDDSSLLDIIKPLAKFIKNLPDYTLHAKEPLSKEVRAVRDAFSQTQSPVKLLFEILPQTCGFETLENVGGFLQTFVQHLKTLENAYPELLKRFKQSLCEALNFDATLDLSALREHCHQYSDLEKYTHNSQGLKAFITRLQNDKKSDVAWLESVATFLGTVQPTKWRKENEIEADYRLVDFGERLNDLLMLHAHQRKVKDGSDTKVTVIRVINETQGEVNHPIPAYIDAKTQHEADKFFNTLGDKFHNSDKRVKLALVMKLLVDNKLL